MKSYELKSLGYWFAFLLLLLFMVSCKSKQSSIDQSESKKDYKFVADSKLIDVKITQPIDNNFSFQMPKVATSKPECDSICQQKLEEYLSTINIQQKNGKNELKLYYDKLNHTLYLNTKMAKTIDSLSKQKHFVNQYFDIRKTKTITITTNVLNKEQKINLWTGRLFWVAFLVWGAFKIRSKVLGIA